MNEPVKYISCWMIYVLCRKMKQEDRCEKSKFVFILFNIYLAASGLSCGPRDL